MAEFKKLHYTTEQVDEAVKIALETVPGIQIKTDELEISKASQNDLDNLSSTVTTQGSKIDINANNINAEVTERTRVTDNLTGQVSVQSETISNLTIGVGKIESRVSTTETEITGLNKTTSEHTTKIKQNADDITLEAKTREESDKGIDERVAAVKITADNITAEVREATGEGTTLDVKLKSIEASVVSGNVVFRQATIPTKREDGKNLIIGDLWFCTADVSGTDYKQEKWYRYNGTGWDVLTDADAKKASSFTSKFTMTPEQIETTVDETHVEVFGDGEKQKSLSSQIKQNADAIESNVKAIEVVGSTVSQHTSQIKQNADSIKTKVEATHDGTTDGFGWSLTKDGFELANLSSGTYNTVFQVTKESASIANSVTLGTKSITSILSDVDTAQKAANNAQTTANSKAKTFAQDSAPTENISTGDLWIDTNDNYKLYRYNGSSWVDVQDTHLDSTVDNLIDKTDKKTTIWYTNYVANKVEVNDIWYDTANSKIKKCTAITPSLTWQDITEDSLKAALDAAGDAQATADSKIQSFAQNDPPEGTDYDIGDLWFDTNDGNKVYRWSGTAWVPYQDLAIALAQQTADSKAKTFAQDEAPTTGMASGDLWIDTNDNNIIYRYNGTKWVKYEDKHLDETLSNLRDLTDGKSTVWYGPAPASPAKNDIWYDTENSKIWKRSDSSWIDITNDALAKALQAAGTAQATADLKIQSFAQDEPPVPSSTVIIDEGDLWFDTNDGNKLYRWEKTAEKPDGEWVPYQDATIAAAKQLAINNKIIAEQTIYYLSETSTTPTAPTTWITDTAKTPGAWRSVVPSPIAKSYYFSCKQTKFADNTVQTSAVIAMDVESTIMSWCKGTDEVKIDGGSLFANSITSAQLKADEIRCENFKFGDDKTTLAKTIEGIVITAAGGNMTFKQATVPTDTAKRKLIVGDLWYVDTETPPTGYTKYKWYRYNGTSWDVLTDGDLTTLNSWKSEFTMTPDTIEQKVTGTEKAVGNDKSGLIYDVATNTASIKTQANKIALVVEEKSGSNVIKAASIVTAINDTGSEVKIAADKITLDGNVVMKSNLTDGTTTISGGNIKTGTISADRIDADNLKVKAANITGELTIGKQIPNDLSKYDNTTTGYQTASGVTSIIDGRVTTDYVDALGITAKKIEVTDTASKLLFKADGLATTPTVNIGGFTVNDKALYNGISSMSDTTTTSGVYIGTDGIKLGKNFKVTSSGKVTASDLTLTGYATTSYADNKASAAQAAAISTAASDATSKANAAQAAAISTAASDATSKAATAKSEAISAASSDATSKADTAKSEAISAAATDAKNKADAAESSAKSYAKTATDTAAYSLADTANNTAGEAKSSAATAIADAATAQDTADKAATAAGKAQNTADGAASAANSAQNTANSAYTLAQGKSKTTYSSTEPTEKTAGDCWFDTTNDILKQYDGSAWQDIGGELVAKKVTAEYINSKNITAKKITVLDSSNNTLFNADGLSDTHAVNIGGFTVNDKALYNGTATSTSYWNKGVYTGTDGILVVGDSTTEGKSTICNYVKLDPATGKITANKGDIAGFKFGEGHTSGGTTYSGKDRFYKPNTSGKYDGIGLYNGTGWLVDDNGQGKEPEEGKTYHSVMLYAGANEDPRNGKFKVTKDGWLFMGGITSTSCTSYFKVDPDGKLSAKGAVINGNIEANGVRVSDSTDTTTIGPKSVSTTDIDASSNINSNTLNTNTLTVGSNLVIGNATIAPVTTYTTETYNYTIEYVSKVSGTENDYSFKVVCRKNGNFAMSPFETFTKQLVLNITGVCGEVVAFLPVDIEFTKSSTQITKTVTVPGGQVLASDQSQAAFKKYKVEPSTTPTSISVNKHFLPSACAQYDLGSSDTKWNKGYFYGGVAQNPAPETASSKRLTGPYSCTFDKLEPVMYKEADNEAYRVGFTVDNIKTALSESGICEEQFAGLVKDHDEKTNTDNYSINYSEFIGILVKEVQDLKKEVKVLRAEVNELKNK